MRNLLGHCEVISDESGVKTLFVSQQIALDRQRNIVEVCKKFTIDSVDGIELVRTKDPNIFINNRGIRYKRIGPFKQGAPALTRRQA